MGPPQAPGRAQSGWANDRRIKSSARAGFPRRLVFRRHRRRAARCTDDVEFIANAPIDILPHMGHRRGKAEIGEMWDTSTPAIPSSAARCRCWSPRATRSPPSSACSSASAATSGWCNSTSPAFYSFRDGRIAQIREIIDTFDLVQQVLERDVAAVLTGKKPNRSSDCVESSFRDARMHTSLDAQCAS